jgi:hypothetical protein
MQVILYKNSAPPNKVNKSANLSNTTDFHNCIFTQKNALDILHPSVLLDMTNDIGDVRKYNYMYIPKFSRYYFIDSISTEGGMIRIDGRCDVLMSHRADILASKQYVIRSQTKNPSPYLEDNMLPIKSTHSYTSKTFGIDVDNIENGRIILATTGNGGTPV